MTTKEFYTAIINDERMTDEMKERATALLESLNKRTSSRSSRPTRTQKENEPIKEAIFQYIAENGPQVASAIGEALNITTNKASSLGNILVKEGKLSVEKVKIPKAGTRNQYSLAGTTAASEEVEEVEDE